jgi:hypothetical protein
VTASAAASAARTRDSDSEGRGCRPLAGVLIEAAGGPGPRDDSDRALPSPYESLSRGRARSRSTGSLSPTRWRTVTRRLDWHWQTSVPVHRRDRDCQWLMTRDWEGGCQSLCKCRPWVTVLPEATMTRTGHLESPVGSDYITTPLVIMISQGVIHKFMLYASSTPCHSMLLHSMCYLRPCYKQMLYGMLLERGVMIDNMYVLELLLYNTLLLAGLIVSTPGCYITYCL